MQKGAVKRRTDHLDSGENSTDTDEDLNRTEQEHDQQRDSPTLRQPTQATARGRRSREVVDKETENMPHTDNHHKQQLVVEGGREVVDKETENMPHTDNQHKQQLVVEGGTEVVDKETENMPHTDNQSRDIIVEDVN